MKKITSIFLSLVLVLGCAAMAFAVPADIPADTKAAVAKGGVQVTIFGDLRFRGTIYKNTQDFNSSVQTGSGVAAGWQNAPTYGFFVNNWSFNPTTPPGSYFAGGTSTPILYYQIPGTQANNNPVPYLYPGGAAAWGTYVAPNGGFWTYPAFTNYQTGLVYAGQVPVLNNVLARASVLNGNGGAINPNQGASERAVFESRIRLGFDIAANANTTGRILLEAGANNQNDNMPWGSTGSASGNNGLVAGDSKANDMRVLEAWLQHKGSGLFGVPAYFKIGHMPIRVANGLFYSHTRFNDDAIVMGIEPVKGFNADFAYIKNAEGNGAYNDDQDTYSLMLNYQIAKNSKIGADVSYVHSQNIGTRFGTTVGSALVANPYATLGSFNMATGVFTPAAQPFLGGFNPNSTYLADINLWNFGINGKTDFGVSGLELKLDAAFQTGKVKDRGMTSWWNAAGIPIHLYDLSVAGNYNAAGSTTGSTFPTFYMGYGDVKLSGWAMTFDASYQFKPVKILAGFGYGSGEDQNIAPADPRTPWIKSHMKNRTFQTTLEGIPHYTFVYEYFTPNAANTVNGGLQNTWYLKLGAAADITKDLYADMTVYYLRAVKNNPYTNPYGFAGKDMALQAGNMAGYNVDATGVAVVNSVAGQTMWNQTAAFRDLNGNPISNSNKHIGVEIDANVKYKIDKNLTYYIEGGYLFAGKFWRNVTGITVDPYTGIANWAKVDDAYAVRSGFQLTF